MSVRERERERGETSTHRAAGQPGRHYFVPNKNILRRLVVVRSKATHTSSSLHPLDHCTIAAIAIEPSLDEYSLLVQELIVHPMHVPNGVFEKGNNIIACRRWSQYPNHHRRPQARFVLDFISPFIVIITLFNSMISNSWCSIDTIHRWVLYN